MAVVPTSSSCLDLTISVPGFHSSSSVSSSGGMRNLDINRVPAEGAEEWMTMMSNESVEEDEENSNGGGGGGGRGEPPPKKLRLSKEQSRLLEDSFRLNHSLNPVDTIPSLFFSPSPSSSSPLSLSCSTLINYT